MQVFLDFFCLPFLLICIVHVSSFVIVELPEQRLDSLDALDITVESDEVAEGAFIELLGCFSHSGYNSESHLFIILFAHFL